MKHVALVLLVASAVALPAGAMAAAPAVIPIQGSLADADGEAIDGDVDMTFVLYDGVGEVWRETQTIPVAGGFFVGYVGAVDDLDLGVFDDGAMLELGVIVAPDEDEIGRVQLGSAPYAAFAAACAEAATLGGLAAADVLTTAYAPDWTTLVNVPADMSDGDQDTTYSAGAGLVLDGDNAFSLAELDCGDGKVLKGIDQAGSPVCVVDATGISAVSCAEGLVFHGVDDQGTPVCTAPATRKVQIPAMLFQPQESEQGEILWSTTSGRLQASGTGKGSSLVAVPLHEGDEITRFECVVRTPPDFPASLTDMTVQLQVLRAQGTVKFPVPTGVSTAVAATHDSADWYDLGEDLSHVVEAGAFYYIEVNADRTTGDSTLLLAGCVVEYVPAL